MTSTEMIQTKEVHLESDPNRGNMVILREHQGADRYFVMFIGDAEFTAIAKEKGLVQPPRPLTHDLYLNMMDKLTPEYLRIEIYDIQNDTFYANVFFKLDGIEHMIDGRPSDAVALALNRKIPILVRQDLFRRKLTEEQVKEYQDVVKTVKF